MFNGNMGDKTTWKMQQHRTLSYYEYVMVWVLSWYDYLQRLKFLLAIFQQMHVTVFITVRHLKKIWVWSVRQKTYITAINWTWEYDPNELPLNASNTTIMDISNSIKAKSIHVARKRPICVNMRFFDGYSYCTFMSALST